jgi:hypothetical protein
MITDRHKRIIALDYIKHEGLKIGSLLAAADDLVKRIEIAYGISISRDDAMYAIQRTFDKYGEYFYPKGD